MDVRELREADEQHSTGIPPNDRVRLDQNGGFRGFRGRTSLEGWYWVTGEPFEYTNWLGRRPNDYFGEDGLQYWPSADSARWNDIDRISGFEPFVHGFLVEYTP
jgi:hypothetical protein